MPASDLKITALTVIGSNPINPATFPIPMVDLLDNSMGGSGTTKKVTVNQILGSGGVATLASATVTGDLTVDTSTLKVDSANDRVGIGHATPAYKLHVQGEAGSQLVLQSNNTDATVKEGTVSARHYTNAEEPISTVGGYATFINNYVYLGGGFSGGNAATFLVFHTAANNTTVTGTERYQIDSTGVSTWSVAGTTAMTLNSTGLRVGTTNDLTGANISSSRGIGTANIATNRFATVEYGSGATGTYTSIIISFTVNSSLSSVIIEILLSGFSVVYLDHVAGKYSASAGVVMRNNASAGTTVAALAVDATGLIYTLTITTVVTHPVIKVKATSGGLGSSITLPVITFA